VTAAGLVLEEIAEGLAVDEVQEVTEAKLITSQRLTQFGA
jgi:acyl CoA:acetate/3-ketoacid CoA transferase beta subunit